MKRGAHKRLNTVLGPVRSVKVGFTTVYLIPCKGGYVQIDTGYASGYERFRSRSGKTGIDPSQIKYLFLTHHHDDHAGFSAQLVRDSGAAIIVHEKAVGPLAGGVTRKGDMQAINRRIKTMFAMWSLLHRYIFPPVTVRDSDMVVTGDDDTILRTIGVKGKVLYTPGHNDECISVVLDDGSAFVGDAAMNMFGFLGARHRPPFVKDAEKLYGSWEHLKRNGAQVIYPAHGKPFGIDELIPRYGGPTRVEGDVSQSS